MEITNDLNLLNTTSVSVTGGVSSVSIRRFYPGVIGDSYPIDYVYQTFNNAAIKEIRTYNNKVVIIDFEDGTSEKSVCHEGDVFSLEMGITICMCKKVLGEKEYRKYVKQGVKFYKDQEIKKEKVKKEEEEQKAAKLRRYEKNKIRKAKQREKRKNY